MTATDPPLAPAADIPIGDLQLFDNYVPALPAGNWMIDVEHSLKHGNETLNDVPLAQSQEFVVSAPQFTIDPGIVVNRYPPANSTARYGEILPHIVLSDPLLPWERSMGDAEDSPVRTPWLALIVLTDDEILGAATSPTRAQATTVGQFTTKDDALLKPSIVREDDIAETQTCQFVAVKTAAFAAIAPRLAELPLLAHCRQVNTGDKAIAGLNEHGLFSVVVANRLPAVPAADDAPPVRNYVHLVSIEGLTDYLAADADFGGHEAVALLSLASWSFQSQPDCKEDFSGLANAIVASEAGGPGALWLALPDPKIVGTDPASLEAAARIGEGFVPLPMRLRTGEDSLAWYRGPLTPVLPAPIAKSEPFPTADAALIYQKSFGLFDASLAAAWEAGRAAALSDRVFAQRLLDFRRRGHGITDKLLDRLGSDHFSASDIAAADPHALVEHEFLDLLSRQLIADVGGGGGGGSGPTPDPAGAPPEPAGTAKADIEAFLADPAMQATLFALVQDDLDPVAKWLAKLLLLYPVPFPYLVPDERMLPLESLRFFYVDANWTGALIDGATSVGMLSSRHSFFHTVTAGLVEDAAYAAAQSLRSTLLGVEPPASESSRQLMSGFLLRSALVSGWPTLAVRPCLEDGTMLKILRMDHLAPDVLLCIVWGVPDYFDLAEPQEGFRFGVNEHGQAALRVPVAGAGGPPLGTQIKDAFVPVFDRSGASKLCMRAAGSRVLNLDPKDPTGVVAALNAALATSAGGALDDFGPADLALQMVNAPESARFTSKTS